MTAWRHDDADVLARVETLRRGDRIYLPGAHTHGPGRVVSHLEQHPARPAAPGVPAAPAAVVVVYFTGERAKPLGGIPDRERGELVTQGLAAMPVGTRIRCRRCIRDE